MPEINLTYYFDTTVLKDGIHEEITQIMLPFASVHFDSEYKMREFSQSSELWLPESKENNFLPSILTSHQTTRTQLYHSKIFGIPFDEIQSICIYIGGLFAAGIVGAIASDAWQAFKKSIRTLFLSSKPYKQRFISFIWVSGDTEIHCNIPLDKGIEEAATIPTWFSNALNKSSGENNGRFNQAAYAVLMKMAMLDKALDDIEKASDQVVEIKEVRHPEMDFLSLSFVYDSHYSTWRLSSGMVRGKSKDGISGKRGHP